MLILVLIAAISFLLSIYFSEKANSKEIEIRKLQSRIQELEEQLNIPDNKVENVYKTYKEPSVSKVTSVEERPQKPPVIETSNIEKPKIQVNQGINYRQYKDTKTELEKRNVTIMTTGAVLVILAAIVFLRSTWSILSDGIKAVGLMLFIVIFYAASKISKEKYKLEDTSKTFFYLAMAYIPICFISLSVLGLVGDYLSIHGDGVFLYMFASFAITATVYCYFFIKQKNVTLFYASLLAQTTSMVMLALVVSKDIKMIALMLLAYSFIICVLCPQSIKKRIELYFHAITYFGLIVALSFFFEKDIILFIILVLSMMNLIAIILRFNNNNRVNCYLLNIVIDLLGFYIFTVCLDKNNYSLNVILMIAYFAIVSYMVNRILKNNKKFEVLINSSLITSAISIAFTYIIVATSQNMFIKPYMVAIIEEIFLLAIYKKYGEDDYSEFIPYLIAIIAFIILHEFLIYIKWWDYIYIALAMCIIGKVIKAIGSKEISNTFVVGATFTSILALIIISNDLYNNMTIKALAFAINLYYLLTTQNHIFKYLSYTTFGILICKDIKIESIKYWVNVVPLLLSIIIIALEFMIKKLRDDYSDFFIAVLQILTYLGMLIINTEISIILAFIYTILMYIYSMIEKEKTISQYISLIGFMVVIMYVKCADEFTILWKMVYIVALMAISAYKKNISLETVLSGIMLVNFIVEDVQNEFMSAMYVTVWSLANVFIAPQEKAKDVFKFLTIVSIVYLYKTILDEFNVSQHFWSLYFIGYVLALMAAMEICIKKYVKAENYQFLEYVFYGIVYIMAITYYKDELDGVIFVAYLILDAMYLSQKDKGNRFKVDIAAIILNAFLLTRMFWLLIPWWIYLLGAGCGLIGFAVMNESKNSKKDNNLKK